MSDQPRGKVVSFIAPLTTNATGLSPPSDLSPEEQEQRVARWERILKGEEEPDYLVVPDEVAKIIRGEEERLYKLHRKHITATARQRMLDSVTMQYCYGGHPVVWMDTPRGRAPLAFGEEEMLLLASRILKSLQRKVVFGFIDPW